MIELKWTLDQKTAIETIKRAIELDTLMPIFLFGERNSGKTAVLYHLDYYYSHNHGVKTHFIFCPYDIDRAVAATRGIGRGKILMMDEITPSSIHADDCRRIRELSYHGVDVVMSGSYMTPNVLQSFGPMIMVGMRRLPDKEENSW